MFLSELHRWWLNNFSGKPLHYKGLEECEIIFFSNFACFVQWACMIHGMSSLATWGVTNCNWALCCRFNHFQYSWLMLWSVRMRVTKTFKHIFWDLHVALSYSYGFLRCKIPSDFAQLCDPSWWLHPWSLGWEELRQGWGRGGLFPLFSRRLCDKQLWRSFLHYRYLIETEQWDSSFWGEGMVLTANLQQHRFWVLWECNCVRSETFVRRWYGRRVCVWTHLPGWKPAA